VLSVKDSRTRSVLAGIVQGIEVPEVREAFRILYEDYPPIRVAGDFLFSRLEATISAVKPEMGLKDPKLSTETLIRAREIFSFVDSDGDGELDAKEVDKFLKIVQKKGFKMTWEEAADFLKELDADQSGTVSFAEFVQGGISKLIGNKKDGGLAILSLGGTKAKESTDKGERKVDKYTKRFNKMITTFREMEESMSLEDIENKRLAKVLEGCLVGGRTPAVVDALRVLYVDYRIIRMCGDLIFGLIKALFK